MNGSLICKLQQEEESRNQSELSKTLPAKHSSN